MNFEAVVGIDCSDLTFTMAIRVPSDEGPCGTMDCSNDLSGIAQAIAFLRKHGLRPEHCQFCIEEAGVICETLGYGLTARGYSVVIADAHKVHKSKDDPYHKTDVRDSVHIADYAIRFQDKLKPWKPKAQAVQQIQALQSTRETLVKGRTSLKNVRSTLSKKHLDMSVASELLNATIKDLDRRITELDELIKQVIKTDPVLIQGVALLKSIPGLGQVTAIAFLVYTNGFADIPTYQRAASHLGIAPRPYESGTSVKRKPRSRRTGQSNIRKDLYFNATTLLRTRAWAKAYYAKKAASGKDGLLIMNNLANKQLRIIMAVLRDWKPFDENYRGINPALLT